MNAMYKFIFSLGLLSGLGVLSGLEGVNYSAFSSDFGLLAYDNTELVSYANEASHRFHFTFNDGYTTIEVGGFHVKITAEQRFEDHMVQVIATPQEQGIRCFIERVDCEVLPPSMNLGGPVAKVHTRFTFRSSIQSFSQAQKVVPVQIASVSKFTTPSDEARMQGYPCIEKRFITIDHQ